MVFIHPLEKEWAQCPFSQARFMLRVLRALPVTRRKMNPIVLRSVMKTFYTADGDRDTKDSLLKFVAEVRSCL